MLFFPLWSFSPLPILATEKDTKFLVGLRKKSFFPSSFGFSVFYLFSAQMLACRLLKCFNPVNFQSHKKLLEFHYFPNSREFRMMFFLLQQMIFNLFSISLSLWLVRCLDSIEHRKPTSSRLEFLHGKSPLQTISFKGCSLVDRSRGQPKHVV